MSRIIVTGGNGFIGRHLVDKLLSRNTHSIVLTSNTSNVNNKYLAEKKTSENRLKFYRADIRDRNTISKIMKDEGVDTCIHLAAKISVLDSIRNPCETMEVNVNGTLNILHSCYTNKVNNFIFASSAAVYGDVAQLPISENHALHPLSPYGMSKMLAEKHVCAYANSKKIQNAISLRIFNPYGVGQTSESDVISKFAKRLSNGLPPVIYGDGNLTRDFISVDDITDAMILSLRKMKMPEDNRNDIFGSPIFNVGTGVPTSIEELAQKMIDIFGHDLSPRHEQVDNLQGIILHSYANPSKAKDLLNFVAKINLDTGLRNMKDQMQK